MTWPTIATGGGIPRLIRDAASGKTTIVSVNCAFGPWLLGLDSGHVPFWGPVFEEDRHTRKANHQIEANTGIAYVAPAWRILDVLNKESLVKQRRREDQQIEKGKKPQQ